MTVTVDDPRLQRTGYAKLVGTGGEYLIKKYETTVGRKNKSKPLDVALDIMSVSREHFKITYNFDKNHFELTVQGKNGLTINGVQHNLGSEPVELTSQAHLQIGNDVSLYFLLPKDPKSVFKLTRKRKLSEVHASQPKLINPVLQQLQQPISSQPQSNTEDGAGNNEEPDAATLVKQIAQRQEQASAAQKHNAQLADMVQKLKQQQKTPSPGSAAAPQQEPQEQKPADPQLLAQVMQLQQEHPELLQAILLQAQQQQQQK